MNKYFLFSFFLVISQWIPIHAQSKKIENADAYNRATCLQRLAPLSEGEGYIPETGAGGAKIVLLPGGKGKNILLYRVYLEGMNTKVYEDIYELNISPLPIGSRVEVRVPNKHTHFGFLKTVPKTRVGFRLDKNGQKVLGLTQFESKLPPRVKPERRGFDQKRKDRVIDEIVTRINSLPDVFDGNHKQFSKPKYRGAYNDRKHFEVYRDVIADRFGSCSKLKNAKIKEAIIAARAELLIRGKAKGQRPRVIKQGTRSSPNVVQLVDTP